VCGDRARRETPLALWPLTDLRCTPVKETRLADFAYDNAAAKRLFNELEDITGVTYAV
jgi:hypothetical protein